MAALKPNNDINPPVVTRGVVSTVMQNGQTTVITMATD